MNLFQRGVFTLRSGRSSNFKIECDVLSTEDYAALAQLSWRWVAPFSEVVGIPRGGVPFAQALEPFARGHGPRLLVDDVYTTGGSIAAHYKRGDKALVVFARGPLPEWVTAIFHLNQQGWGQ